MTQKNDFKNANFYGNTQIVNGDVHNVHTQNTPNSINENEIATYTPEPIWRSPITMAWLCLLYTSDAADDYMPV